MIAAPPAFLLEEPSTKINREQSRPERQGLFGLLSIGFITSSIATMIGFLLYTVFSYRRRYVELGILRAIGLSQRSMILSVAWELGLLIVMGLAIGLGIGLLVSVLYIPYMQFVSSLEGTAPPYVVTMAWTEIGQIVALFLATFALIMVILLVILRRMRIFQAVKLGGRRSSASATLRSRQDNGASYRLTPHNHRIASAINHQGDKSGRSRRSSYAIGATHRAARTKHIWCCKGLLLLYGPAGG